jgi:hypothetical protein
VGYSWLALYPEQRKVEVPAPLHKTVLKPKAVYTPDGIFRAISSMFWWMVSIPTPDTLSSTYRSFPSILFLGAYPVIHCNRVSSASAFFFLISFSLANSTLITSVFTKSDSVRPSHHFKR